MRDGLGIGPWSTYMDASYVRAGGLEGAAMELDQLRRD